jgi:small subunit ribosomal protein S4
MKRVKEKAERSLRMKLFLKGDRCNSPKCVTVRRAYAPGQHGKNRRPPASEYGIQLLEKQRLRVSYGLKERQLKRVLEKALKKRGATGATLINLLESQLVNVVYRLGFAPSRFAGRQLITHGHFLVNGKKVTVPSYALKVGDVISIKESSKSLLIFKDLPNILKKQEVPDWLELDKEKMLGRIKSLPTTIEIPFDINLIVDYYSK